MDSECPSRCVGSAARWAVPARAQTIRSVKAGRGPPAWEYYDLKEKQRTQRRCVLMATFIMLSKLTDEGRKTLKERPQRLAQVNKEIETLGGRVTAQFAVLGEYDFVNVIEAARGFPGLESSLARPIPTSPPGCEKRRPGRFF